MASLPVVPTGHMLASIDKHMEKTKYFYIILILGALAALGPFSIDMYLPAFVDIALDLHSSEAAVALSLSSFFLGISAGQLMYGPLLDRYGRKKPLYVGLCIYIIASLACLVVDSVNQLIMLRFIQAVGSCAAAVASVAMVRDLFPLDERPRAIASLILVISLSPMLAPTAGGYVISAFGWKYVFVFLALIATIILVVCKLKLPESYQPDPDYSLRPRRILNNFALVLKEPQFSTYSLIGSLTFSGLFAYVSSSPTVFMKLYGVSKTGYGWIFAMLSIAFIGSSQLNGRLVKRLGSQKIMIRALISQVLISLIFLLFALENWLDLYSTITFISLYLFCLGFIIPNAAALALAPFNKNAGSASAILGALEMGSGALASFVVSICSDHPNLPMPLVMSEATLIGMCCLIIGCRFIRSEKLSQVNIEATGH